MSGAKSGLPGFDDRPEVEGENLTLGMGSPSPAEVVELLRKWRSPGGCGRLRRFERHNCAIGASIQYTIQTQSGSRNFEARVVTEDISAGGIGFTSDRPIASGTVISARLDGMDDEPPLTGVVRRCARLDEHKYRIGAEFEPQPGA